MSSPVWAHLSPTSGNAEYPTCQQVQCWSKPGVVWESQLFPFQEFYESVDITVIAQNWPWWECFQHRDQQMLK